MSTQTVEDEALNRAILESIQDEMNKRKGLETKRPREEEKVRDPDPFIVDQLIPTTPVATPVPALIAPPPDPRPPKPPKNPPHSGMTLHTFIRNGWVGQEWR
jgi:hypothetical protein